MVAVSVSTAAVLWEWNFQQLPEGWTANEYWEFSAAGGHSFVSVSTSGPYSSTITSYLVSPAYTVPGGVTHLLVTLTSDWDLSGWWSTGESHCYIWGRLYTADNDYTLEFDSRSWGFMQFSSCPCGDTVTIPVSEGTQYYLHLKSSASSSFGAGAAADWTVSQISITDQSGSELSRNTWGAIKGSF